MHYVIALGNPGERYANSRHNVGWMVADAWRKRGEWMLPEAAGECRGRVVRGLCGGEEVALLYPETYMNKVGEAAAKFVPPEMLGRLIVVHDDIDLPLGVVKVSVGRGDGGHNGLRSLIAHLRSKQFVRVRVGIMPRHPLTGTPRRPEGGAALERFVLKPFSLLERPLLPGIISRASVALDCIVAEGPQAAMNRYNRE